jgi:hypothetical protein
MNGKAARLQLLTQLENVSPPRSTEEQLKILDYVYRELAGVLAPHGNTRWITNPQSPAKCGGGGEGHLEGQALLEGEEGGR